jgi:hypothetical protein
LVVSVDFLVVSLDFFVVDFVDDFLVVDVLAGGVVVVAVSVLLVLVQAPIRPAANRAVNE